MNILWLSMLGGTICCLIGGLLVMVRNQLDAHLRGDRSKEAVNSNYL